MILFIILMTTVDRIPSDTLALQGQQWPREQSC